MTQVSSNFETGTVGNSLSTGDTGSPTAFNNVYAFSSNTVKYTSDAAHGSKAMQCDTTPTPASIAAIVWTTAMGTVTTHYGRINIKLTANPATDYRFLDLLLPAEAGFVGGLRINSSGQVVGVNKNSAPSVNTTSSITLNQYVRIEFMFIHSATVGQIEIKLFNSVDSTTATDSQISAANLDLGANCGTIYCGLSSGGSGTVAKIDDVVFGATSYPGPVVTSTVRVPRNAAVNFQNPAVFIKKIKDKWPRNKNGIFVPRLPLVLG